VTSYFVVVEAAGLASCDGVRRQTAVVSRQSGYLAGVWAAETGCGTVDAPWQVRVKPGQRINVTLFDFTVAASTSNRTRSSAVADSETVFAAAGIGPHHALPVHSNSARYTRISASQAAR